MSVKNINFDDKNIKKVTFTKTKKYFRQITLMLFLLQMTGYASTFVENTTMSFRANKKQLLKKYNKIWEKVAKLMKINFESKPVYGDDDKYTKTKTKIYAGSVLQIFMIKKMLKEKVPCKCLSIIILDSVIKTNKKIILEYFQKNANMYKKR